MMASYHTLNTSSIISICMTRIFVFLLMSSFEIISGATKFNLCNAMNDIGKYPDIHLYGLQGSESLLKEILKRPRSGTFSESCTEFCIIEKDLNSSSWNFKESMYIGIYTLFFQRPFSAVAILTFYKISPFKSI